MSKPYFTQLLPVEGDIQIGDIVQGESGYYYQVAEIDPMTVQARSIKAELINLSKCRKVKLFLCSRDIQVGDTCMFKHPIRGEDDFNPEEEHIIVDLHHSDYKPYEVRTNNGYGPKEAYFKVIGEVSPDATWVKEGMEFEQDDILLCDFHPIWDQTDCCTDCPNKNWCVRKGCSKKPITVQFRCPSSPNHFH